MTTNRRRAVIGGGAFLGIAGACLASALALAPDHAPSSITVDDTADILYEPDLREAIDELRFYQPTDVAIFTHRGGTEALTDDYALNDATLEHARTERDEWLSQNRQKWADDLFIFGVDPEGRLVGTYFGENRKVGEDTQLDIQETAKDDFRAGQWTEGVITGVSSGADRMNAPFIRTTGGAVLGGLASLGTLVGAGAWWGVGANRAGRSRRMRKEGDTAMANVIGDVDVTELQAGLIPKESRYGGLILRRFDEYNAGVRELTELGNEVRSVADDAYNQRAVLTQMTAYRDQAQSMDRLDDVIADTAAFLSRDRVWREAWGRQEQPIRDDLQQVDSMLSDDIPKEARGVPEAKELREYATASLTRLDELRSQLENEQVSPDDALDELKKIRDGQSDLLDRLASAVVDKATKTRAEENKMIDAMHKQRNGKRTPEITILSTADPTWSWYPIDSFKVGLTDGTRAVEQSRAPSGGSTSGYSSSGGSFSGAGSSSRF